MQKRKPAKIAVKKHAVSFINLAPIVQILQTAIWTGRLSDEKPVSVLLVAQQESAKTELLKYFRGTSTLRYISDLSSRGLLPFRKDIESKKLRHIVLLDLVRVLNHGRTISERTIQTLASLMEEGESETSDAGGSQQWANFPKIGVLMAVTPDFFNSKRGRWRATGFLTRFLPVTFNYTPETIRKIHYAIKEGHHLPLPRPQAIPDGDCLITCAPEHSEALSRKAQELGERMKTYGFRYQRCLRALCKAHARMENRGRTNHKDLAKVLEWSEFFTERAVTL